MVAIRDAAWPTDESRTCISTCKGNCVPFGESKANFSSIFKARLASSRFTGILSEIAHY